MTKVNKSVGCLMIIIIFASLISTVYTGYKSIPEFCLISKHANYYLYPERYKKLNVEIDEWNISEVSFDFDYGISTHLENGNIPISITNPEKLNIELLNMAYEYFDEFHLVPTYENSSTGKLDEVIDLYAYNRKFNIYFNEQDWIAFYNPYLKANFIDNTLYILGKCDYIIPFVISFLCFIFSERFASANALSDPKIKEDYNHTSRSVIANIFIIGISGIVTLFAIFFTFRFAWQANKDWYANYEQYVKKEVKIKDYKVEKDVYNYRTGGKGQVRTIWTNFLGYNGVCTSDELNNGKTAIFNYQNREISNEIQDTTHYYKHTVWYNPENKTAYLPSSNEKLQSRFMVFVDMVINHWFLYIGLLILLMYYIYWKKIFKSTNSKYKKDESLKEQYNFTKKRTYDN